MMRRTKIISTLGPAVADEKTIEEILIAGTDLFRLNFSHGDHANHCRYAEMARSVANKIGKHIALIGDLQGPKIRIGAFIDGKIELKEGDTFILDMNLPLDQGDQHRVGVTYVNLAKECTIGQLLVLNDGSIELEIVEADEHSLNTRVIVGGILQSNKGINLRNGGLSAPALTDKDRKDMEAIAQMRLDYIALSFPAKADDIKAARQSMQDNGIHDAHLIAKIERAEAVADDNRLDELIELSDSVMVARGDLGVEIGDAELIGTQKNIISRARNMDRTVITATQMMESMIEKPLPTRAEVFDVANAVLDGADALMLSAETALGQFPVKVVESMHRIIVGAEKNPIAQKSLHRIDQKFRRTDESIAMATMYTANHLDSIKCVLCLTESGYTPLAMSRIRSHIPVYALSVHEHVLNRVCLYRGVTPFLNEWRDAQPMLVVENTIAKLKKNNVLHQNDLVLCVFGDFVGHQGMTNTLKIVTTP